MRTNALAVMVSALLLLQACERQGGNPPKPVAAVLQQVAQMA